MTNLVFLKLGGSLITDKTRDAVARPEVIRDIGRVLAQARAREPELRLLLGHGSGSFGHAAAKRSGFGDPGHWEGYAETGAAAARLNRIVTDTLLEAGLPVVSHQPSASARCRDGRLLDLSVEPVYQTLAHNLIPLVYGDVAYDETHGRTIVSTEMLFAFLARPLRPDRILLVGEVEGVYTADPRRDPQATLVPELSPAQLAAQPIAVDGSHGTDVTGGMADKVQRMFALAAEFPQIEIRILGASSVYPALLDSAAAQGTRITA